MKITPVLLVESVEKSLPFWTDRMGWNKIAEVPDGESLAFAMLAHEDALLMLQTLESARKDEPKFINDAGMYRTSLFVEVDEWPDIISRLEGYEITMPERETFYGMREIGVFEPSGHVVIFAQRLDKNTTEA